MSRQNASAAAAHDRAPAALRWAVRVLVAQAAGMTAVVVLLVYENLTAPTGSVGGGIVVTVYAALIAGVLGFLGRALARRRGWARGPAIVLQLLLLPMGYSMLASGLPGLGLPVVLAGLVGAGTLLAPATRAALGLR